MARKFPRFLFSNPTNTKSPGPFVISLLKPRIVCRLVNTKTEDVSKLGRHYTHFTGLTVELLDVLHPEDEVNDTQVSNCMHEMLDWCFNQQDVRELFLDGSIHLKEHNDIVKALASIGFKYIPMTSKGPGGVNIPVEIDGYGDYIFENPTTFLILTINGNGWQISDGSPDVRKVYSSGENFDLEHIVALLIQVGNNKDKRRGPSNSCVFPK